MSAQRGFLSEAGPHKPFDERSAWFFLSEAGSHKPFGERPALIFFPEGGVGLLCGIDGRVGVFPAH